jgi:mannose-6-phosphate isomerase-like protein (cupin superfamily)
MEAMFNEIFTEPQNEVFKVVFYPDRIYHAEYLNATRSERYRYNVREVRNSIGITVLKGQVFMDDRFLTNFVRIEYKPDRLVELVREQQRFLRQSIMGWCRLLPNDQSKIAESMFKLHYCPWIDAYQVEFWETLEPTPGSYHDHKVLDIMGKDASITRIRQFAPALGKTDGDLKGLGRLELAFRENDKDLPFGYTIRQPQWDNNFTRSHQEPRSTEPSSSQNTIQDGNYLIDFQRGWFIDTNDVQPVRYRNAMMDGDARRLLDPGNGDLRVDPNQADPDLFDQNIIEMRWIVQRELGSSVVFFHEVTLPPGTVEGTHRHIGTEELYFITEGEGIAYMGENDDPKLAQRPVVTRNVYGYGPRRVRELPVRRGNVIFTKSGGIHGIRNTGTVPLKFVAFLYHTT